jgi:transmembrane 9 superfamily protein 2/4
MMQRRFLLAIAFVVVAVAATIADASFLKGVMPKGYTDFEPLPVLVSQLTSTSRIMPMNWYGTMPWCQISKDDRKASRKSRNFGERLWGQSTEASLYRLDMHANITCAPVCGGALPVTPEDSKRMQKMIEDNYRGHLMLDGLPVAEAGTNRRNRLRPSIMRGFPLGVPKAASPEGKTLVNNHLAFTVQVHPNSEPVAFGEDEDKHEWRIVGFQVTPLSIDHSQTKCSNALDVFEAAANHPMLADKREIQWTYSVNFEESDVEWSTRWDVYMQTSKTESRVHLVSVLNSTLVVILLSAIVAIILIRALKRDIQAFNQMDAEALEEERGETGWKHLHADVFRKPEYAGLLAVLVGSGMQLFALSCLTISFACAGFVSPKRRGSLLTAFVFLFVLLGSLGGWVTGHMAKQFQMKSWKIIFAVGLFFPGSLFGCYFLLNLVHWGAKASSATPIGTMLILMCLWFCVSLPLVLIGGAAAYRSEFVESELQKKVGLIPRTVPPQPWFMHPVVMCLLPGILPFGASFIEYSFILSSVWQGHIYYVFGFLFVAFVLVMVIVAETCIFLTYLRLVRMDHNWWWPAYFTGASYGVWIFLYGAYYFFRILTIRNVWSVILYFGYNAMISYAAAVTTGAVGFCAAEAFVKIIFNSLRLE